MPHSFSRIQRAERNIGELLHAALFRGPAEPLADLVRDAGPDLRVRIRDEVHDAAEARLQQLQSARAKRAQAPEPASAAKLQTQPQAAQAPKTQPSNAQTTSKEEAKLISEFARKTGIPYPEAWTLYQQEKKATAQPPAL